MSITRSLLLASGEDDRKNLTTFLSDNHYTVNQDADTAELIISCSERILGERTVVDWKAIISAVQSETIDKSDFRAAVVKESQIYKIRITPGDFPVTDVFKRISKRLEKSYGCLVRDISKLISDIRIFIPDNSAPQGSYPYIDIYSAKGASLAKSKDNGQRLVNKIYKLFFATGVSQDPNYCKGIEALDNYLTLKKWKDTIPGHSRRDLDSSCFLHITQGPDMIKERAVKRSLESAYKGYYNTDIFAYKSNDGSKKANVKKPESIIDEASLMKSEEKLFKIRFFNGCTLEHPRILAFPY